MKKLALLVLVIGLVGFVSADNLFSHSQNPNKVIQNISTIGQTDLSRSEDTINYDGPNAANGIGLTAGGTFWGAVRFTPVDGCTLKSAIFFQYQEVTASGMIYVHAAGTSTAPGAKIDSAPYSNTPGAWVRVNFTNPIVMQAGVDFWLNVRLTHAQYYYPFGVDAGPGVVPYRSFVSTDGSAWTALPAIPLNYNWNLRAIVGYRRFANDVGVDQIIAPTATHRVNTVMNPIAKIKNYGSSAQTTSFSVVCTMLGAGSVVRYTDTKTVASLGVGETTRVNFDAWTPTITENLTVIMRTNLAGDENTGNDRKTRSTQVSLDLLSETFNDATFPPAGWQANIIGGTYNWERFTSGTYPTCTPYEGDGMTGYRSFSASSGNSARLISPAIALGSTPMRCTLKFWMMHDPGYTTAPDSIKVEYSTNGTAFTRVAAFNRYAATQAWAEHAVYLGEFSGTIYVGFLAVSGYGNSMYMDFVRLSANPGLPPPQKDVGVDVIVAPGGIHQVGVPMAPIARVKNFGAATQTFPVVCSIIGAGSAVRYTNTQTVTSLAAGDTARVNFTSWTPTVLENVTVIMRTNLANDSVPTNDRMTRTTMISGYMIAEGFEDATFPPTGWQAVIGSGTYNWDRKTSNTYPTCVPYEGTAMASYQCFSASAGSYARLISPAIAVGTSNPCTLKFWMYHDPGYPGDLGPDSVKIEYSTDGTNFTQVAAFVRYDAVEAWVEHTVYLGTFSGTLYFGILGWSDYGNNINIDYVRLSGRQGIEEQNPNNVFIPTALNAPKPNPVTNGLANISFSISAPTKASLKIYDASGRMVTTLVNSKLDRGTYNYIWNGTDDNNREVAEGIYFYTLQTEAKNYTKKLVFTR